MKPPYRLSVANPPECLPQAWQPTNYQRAFLESPARYTVIEAGTKTGKTTACLHWLWHQAQEAPAGSVLWWLAPVYAQARIAMRRMWRLVQGHNPPKRRMAGLELELPNGSLLQFKSAHDPDNLYGEDVGALVIDEATRCPPEAWHAARSTLTATRGPVKIIGNVKGRANWVRQLALRAEQAQTGEYAYFKITAYDAVAAGILAAAEVEDARLHLPAEVFNELYLAEPSDDGGNPFGLAHIAACLLPPELPLAHGPAFAFGVDFGKRHDWSVVVGLNRAGEVAVFERFRTDWAETARRVAALVGPNAALADSTGVGDAVVEALQRQLPRLQGFTFTSRTKQQLMEQLVRALHERAVRLPANGLLRRELEAFEFKLRPGSSLVKYSAPHGQHDDCVCAFALAVHCHEALQPNRSGPANAFWLG